MHICYYRHVRLITTKEKKMENINHLVEEVMIESEIEELLLEVKNLESLKRIQKALNQRKKEVA